MKLNRDNYIKMDYQGGMLYQYVCNETDFFLLVEGKGQDKKMSVFKGSVDSRQEEFNTSDTLEAWNKFEEMLTVCEPEQGSSGGFKNNPQQNPNILPLLAIKRLDSGDFTVSLFAAIGDNEQVTAMSFTVGANALKYPFPPSVFVVDWKDEEIPAIFKCEILMKRYSDVEFEEDKDCEVFLFIPKSIINQGGEEGGNADGGNEQPDDGQPDDGQPDDGQPDDGQPDDGQPDDGQPDDGQPDGGQPDDGQPDDEETDGEPTQGTGQPTNERIDDDAPTVEQPPIDFGDTVRRLSELTNISPSTVINVFRSVRNGETWLLTNNFENIKRQLNLPPSTTAADFSQQIINSK
jgi:hypothetical protein